ncbi:hypothetical protein D9758_009642 [Tetrapyrgos nigripes]|uniref:Alcohol dehydrogenase-like N-terminal domain-containing protein n=1 Tax=Tetrapyrgos nigripes TaxID=182062 RepID=A0A8H5CNU2_9AGAR|nr:hypothetical protein D9758_009642 [Tetrapyrgos nigripes]
MPVKCTRISMNSSLLLGTYGCRYIMTRRKLEILDTMSFQKAFVLDSRKGSFIVTTRPIPKPGSGSLLVKIQATALNPVDWKIQAHDLEFLAKEFPAVLGSDAAGDVEEVGEGVEGWKRGDRIYFQGYYTNDQATFQQYCLISADVAAKACAMSSFDETFCSPADIVFHRSQKDIATPKQPLFLLPSHVVYLVFSPEADRSCFESYFRPHCEVYGTASSGTIFFLLSVSITLTYLQSALGVLHQSGNMFSPIIAYASAKHGPYLKELGATHIIDRQSVSFANLPSTVSNILSETTSSPSNSSSTPFLVTMLKKLDTHV